MTVCAPATPSPSGAPGTDHSLEMEALAAASVGLLTIYDMVKAVDRAMVLRDIRLEEKRGGKSGDYRR